MLSPEFKQDVLARWDALDPIQRKRVLFLAALLPLLVLATNHLSCRRARPAPHVVEAAVAAPVASEPIRPLSNMHAPAFDEFPGRWYGRAYIANHGVCTLNLEMQAAPPNTHYQGFPQLACTPPGKHNPHTNPSSAIMTGELKNHSIAFHLAQTTSANEMNCNLDKLNVTGFGTNRIAAEWSDACGGGNMLLSRSR